MTKEGKNSCQFPRGLSSVDLGLLNSFLGADRRCTVAISREQPVGEVEDIESFVSYWVHLNREADGSLIIIQRSDLAGHDSASGTPHLSIVLDANAEISKIHRLSPTPETLFDRSAPASLSLRELEGHVTRLNADLKNRGTRHRM